MSELEKIQDLYDRSLFLQAYGQSTDYWSPSTDLTHLSIDELILASRLSARLGGLRLSRWLSRAACRRDPSNPRVKYFIGGTRWRGWHFADDLRAFEENSDLNDPQLRAWWLASYAVTWARLRDFDRADAYLDRARSLAEPDGWVWACASNVAGHADRWEEALERAERACEIEPGAPCAVQSLCDSLVSLGRLGEATERGTTAAEQSESYEVVFAGHWHLCMLAETLDSGARLGALHRAQRLVDRLPALAPLADRETRRLFARARLDIAELLGDHEEMARWAEEVRSPFHRRVVENLRKNPNGLRIRLRFRRAQQKYSACLPTSISSALAATGVHLDTDAMATEITYGGTPGWAAAEWLEKRGLVVRFFIVSPDLASSLIKHGIPFVLTLTEDEFSHAVAVIGLDEAAGTLLIHDPAQPRMAACLLKEIAQNEGPLDPSGMAVVSPETALLLDSLLVDADPRAAAALHLWQKELETNGPSAARRVVDELAGQQPIHRGTRLLQAMQASQEGSTSEALAGFQQLLNEFPNSPFVRRNLLLTCASLGNLALMRQVLVDVVERAVLPGIQSAQEWRYPPATYVCQYADHLRLSAASRKRSRALLNSIIDRQGICAEAWHVLGELLWQEHDRNGALLCYRLASCLERHNEHYASAYHFVLRASGREDDSLTWLRTRVDQFGASPRATGPWISWIAALEACGRPERAVIACQEALQQHGSTPELLAFATCFFARMGHWDESEAQLRRLGTVGHSALHCEAAVAFHRMRGELDAAIGHGEEWSRQFPHSVAARMQLLDLVAKRDGARAAVDLARRWSADRRGHDQFEQLYYVRMDTAGGQWKMDLLLARRVKRNSEDAWAWQQLAFRRLGDYNRTGSRGREKLHPRILRLLGQCDRTAPEAPATLRAHALWSELRGLWRDAVAAWLAAIDEDAGSFYGYQHAWECCASFKDAERHRVFEQMEPLLLNCTGPLSFARNMVFLLADRFGVAAAEEIVTRWRLERPDDADVIEAAAGLMLKHGHGRAGAARAMDLLEPAAQRFPYHLGLRFSLAQAHANVGEQAEAAETLQDIIRRHPDETAAHIQLASLHERRGELDEALRLLEHAGARDPLNPEVWRVRAGILIRSGSLSDARAIIRKGLRLLPDNAAWREAAVQLLFESKDDEGAVEAAREGAALCPHDVLVWWLLARTLHQQVRFAAPGEIESCLRRSLSLSALAFQPADLLAMILVEQGRHGEAEEIINRILPDMPDPSPARGRLAWIHHQQGRKDEALEDMAAAVASAPWYLWGWNTLMLWLFEEQKWDTARSLLDSIPPEVRLDANFRAQRLTVLTHAGLPQDRLDAEWSDLLRDFPEDVPLHLQRYDILRAARRRGDAVETLHAIQAVGPDNPFMLARLVEVLAEAGKKDEAIEALQRIWFARVELSTWPAEYGWKAAERTHFDEEAYRDARWSLNRGSRPTPQALSLMAAHAMEREFLQKKLRQPLWRILFPGPGGREVLALFHMVDRAPWATGSYRAVLFRRLSEFGYQGLVAYYAKENRAAVEADVESWAEAAHALVSLKRKRAARKMLLAWRERMGVRMATVADYVSCFRRRGRQNQREVLSACHDALARLTHDHCAKYMAHVEAEMCALLDDTEAFRKTWIEHRRYFTGKLEKSEWFERQREYLLSTIPRMGELLDQNRTDLFQNACRQLREGGIAMPLLSDAGSKHFRDALRFFKRPFRFY